MAQVTMAQTVAMMAQELEAMVTEAETTAQAMAAVQAETAAMAAVQALEEMAAELGLAGTVVVQAETVAKQK